MDRDRWERIQSVFHDVVDRPESDRAALLKAACGGDDDLMADVAALLQEDASRASVLDRDLARIAHQVVDAPLKSLPLEEFGPYRIKGILGEGGMGVVYLAEREDLGSEVAIKILRDAWLSPARLARFESEQRTLANLNHPAIARFYDTGGLANGTPWFAMEYVEGAPLTDYCRTRECSIEERLRLLRSVCEAVQYAHSQAIIHRDLKPSNILVKTDGTVKLLDFGIAKHLEGLDGAADQTRTALRLMTPAYAAPEQIQGGRAATRSDVYSLGVILYELLAGRLPFDLSKRTPGEAELAIVHSEPEKPSVVAATHPGVPRAGKSAWADLDVLCLTAMHKDPGRRYRSVEALVRDIDHYLKGEPLEAQPDTLPYKIGKFVRRNRRAVAAAVIAFTVVAVQAAVFTIRLARSRNAALAVTARTQRVERFMMNLFEGGDNEAAPSNQLRVTTLLDRGVRQAGALDSDPETQAELYETLGSMYQQLGDYQKADRLLLAGLDKAKAAAGRGNPKVASALVQLGVLRADQAQYQDAVRLLREGLDTASRNLPPDDPTALDAKANLARVLTQSGSYKDAIPILEDVIQVKPAGETGAYILREGLSTLSVAEYYAGHYKTSESLARRAIALDRQLLGKWHPKTGTDLVNLGTTKAAMGEYSEAEGLYREGTEILSGWYGPDHPDTATSMAVLAATLIKEGKDAEAGTLLQQVLRIQERVYGKVHDRIALTLDMLGRIATKRGDLASAQGDLNRAIAIDQSLLGDANFRTAVIKVDLADAYILGAKYKEAEEILRKAVKVMTTSLPPGDAHIGFAQASWGDALLHLKRYDEAESELTAGYQILEKQSHPPFARIQAVRHDLAAVYDALHQSQNVKQLLRELDSTANK